MERRELVIFEAEKLKETSKRILLAAGATEHEAAIVADLLIEANLHGVDSHGIALLPGICSRIKEGRVIPGSEIAVEKESESTVIVNGHGGFGQVVASKCVDIAVRKARRNNVCLLLSYNLDHIAWVGGYSIRVAEHGMVGIVLCRGGTHVAPYGGVSRVLGANPLSYAFPSVKGKPPIFFDASTMMLAEAGMEWCIGGLVAFSLLRKEIEEWS